MTKDSFNIRNIRLLVIDDCDISGEIPEFIDLLLIGNRNRIDSWNEHCRSLFYERDLDFDLLTVDMIFDDQDPFYVLIRGNELCNIASEHFHSTTCSGLYHGMMSLARRQETDQYFNLIPLAWEMRSAQPQIFIDYPFLMVEAVRAYGLLRSLLGQNSAPDTSLEEFLISKFDGLQLSGHGHTEQKLENIRKTIGENSLTYLMLRDLVCQPNIEGAARGTVARLLPKWRNEFLIYVNRGLIKVDNIILKKQIEILSSLKTTNEHECSLPALSNLFVPIADQQLNKQYGLRLASIFADIKLPNEENIKEVKNWLIKVVQDSETSYENLIKVAKEFLGRNDNLSASIKHKEGKKNWEVLSYPEQCAVFCLAILRPKLANKYKYETTQNAIAFMLGLENHHLTFWRPFKKTNFAGCGSAQEFVKKLNKALNHNNQHSEKRLPKPLLVAIYNYCIQDLDISENKLVDKAPGLVQAVRDI